jgi:hypothetical protein
MHSLGQYSMNCIQKYLKVWSVVGVSVNFSVRKRIFDAILISGRNFEFMPYFFNKIWSFLEIKPLEDWKNVLSLIYWKLTKIGPLKSAILNNAAILIFIKKTHIWFLEHIFKKWALLKSLCRPSVRLSVCPSVRLFVCHLFLGRYST